jgi:hypothetical protein
MLDGEEVAEAMSRGVKLEDAGAVAAEPESQDAGEKPGDEPKDDAVGDEPAAEKEKGK